MDLRLTSSVMDLRLDLRLAIPSTQTGHTEYPDWPYWTHEFPDWLYRTHVFPDWPYPSMTPRLAIPVNDSQTGHTVYVRLAIQYTSDWPYRGHTEVGHTEVIPRLAIPDMYPYWPYRTWTSLAIPDMPVHARTCPYTLLLTSTKGPHGQFMHV